MITAERPQTEDPVTSPQPGTRGRRRLVVLAAAVLFIPSAVGFVLLRSSGSDPPAGAGGSADAGSVGPAVIRQSTDGSSEIVSSEDMLQPSATASSTASTRIKYLLNDEVFPLSNGGSIALGEDLNLEVFLAPYPPTDFDSDVDLYVTTATGQPVTDASITVTYDMVFMLHGPFDVTFENVGGGHYVAPFVFFMYGPWELLTDIEIPGQPGPELALSIYVWPE